MKEDKKVLYSKLFLYTIVCILVYAANFIAAGTFCGLVLSSLADHNYFVAGMFMPVAVYFLASFAQLAGATEDFQPKYDNFDKMLEKFRADMIKRVKDARLKVNSIDSKNE